jgi:hypothetical protein
VNELNTDPYATIDPARVALGDVTATEQELFKVLAYVREHRNRRPVDPRTMSAKSKTLTEMAYELEMAKDAVAGGLWYWGFMEARDAARAAALPEETAVATHPQRRSPKARTSFKFDPHGFDK